MDDCNYDLIRKKCEAIVYYIKRYYFPSLIAAGHHVLYSIPMFDKTTQGNRSGSLTSIKFQMYPFYSSPTAPIAEGVWGKLSHLYERNMIALLGMTNSHEMPYGWLPHDLCLTPGPRGSGKRGKKSYGSVTLSRTALAVVRRMVAGEAVDAASSGLGAREWRELTIAMGRSA